MAGGIFVITEKDQLVEMQEAPYESEDILQSMLSKFPRLISSYAHNDEGSDWLLVSREISVPDSQDGRGRWSLDHLFLDSEGIPIFVEVKRSTDTRIRREVVGQMLDYAANAVVYWPINYLQEKVSQDELETFLNDRIEAEAFWEKVKTNLQAGKIRLLFVADEIPNELKRIIEFLNEQMDPAEVLGIEVKQFVNDKLRTIVPTVIGNTAEAEARKRSLTPSQINNNERLIETVETFNQLANGSYQATGSALSYRVIKIFGFPGALHYEFVSRKEGIFVDFHVESAKYTGLLSTLDSLVKEHPEIYGGKVSSDIPWYKSKGGCLLRVSPKQNSPEEVAKTMLEFINISKDRIREAIADIENCAIETL